MGDINYSIENNVSEAVDDSGIARAVAAYQWYSREQSSLVRDDLIRQGKDAGMGDVVKIVSSNWKALSPDEREPYEKLGREDRARYNEACRVRDAAVLAEQEERRRNNQMTSTDTRMRNTTLSNTEALAIKDAAPKRTRELSEREVKDKEARKVVKTAEKKAEAKQSATMKAEKAKQAEARLKYLLGQSDIFAHFGNKGKKSTSASASADGETPTKQKNSSKYAPDSARRRKTGESTENLAELDEDEAAMLEDGGDNDNDGKGVQLTSQPSIITGGLLRPYQLEGLNWMIRLMDNGLSGILADEMGLGKTLQSISIVAYQYQHLNIKGPHLIMVPKSTLSNWMNEFKRFCPTIRTLRFHGTKEERAEIVEKRLNQAKASSKGERDWDVVVTTYEIVNMEKNALTKIHWKYLIIDEAHRLKNEASQFSQTVRLLQTSHRLLLTGTPLQNNLHELWALLNFLLPDIFASAEQFDEWFDLDVEDTEAKQRIIQQLHKLLRPFMLRRLKVDVEKSLPPKTETILFTGLSAMQKALYKGILLRDIDTINSGEGNKGSRTAVLNIVMQLRKACNHPYLFPGQEDRTLDPLGPHLYESCGKMVLLHRLLLKMKERGHRVLLFSQMTKMIDIFEDYFIGMGYKYCRIDGNTSYEDREDGIASFNAPNSEKFIFVLSTRAGGLGINLQTADTVILYDSDWNPQADLQAQDRAHRIGQKKPVQIFRLVTENTVEEKVVERAQQKLKLDAMVVQQGRLQDKEKKMSTDDLLDTLRFGADKIFKSKDSSISDADIDTILEQGRKKTEEMQKNMQKSEKGDMYDFSLDGGMKTQEFDGVDYSDRNTRENELSTLATLAFIDPGKRERKVIASYSESMRDMAPADEDAKKKMPRHLRLPKMDDWQFYNKVRLEELHAKENELFEQLVEKGEVPEAGKVTQFIILPQDLQSEKDRLLSEGFKDWTRVTFNSFIKAVAKYGRKEYDKISRELQLPIDEIERYSTSFWAIGEAHLGSDEFGNKVKQIEKGEKHVEGITRLTNATAKLISRFDDPWENLSFKHSSSSNRIFNVAEDRFLLCLTHLHGYGNWNKVRSSIQRSDRFRFDSYLQSCSEETLGKRCEILMRAAERELIEIERKEQTDAVKSSSSSGKATVDAEKIKKMSSDLVTASRKLSNIRNDLKKLRSGDMQNGKAAPGSKAAKAGSSIAKVSVVKSASASVKPSTAKPAAKTGSKPATKSLFPANLLPDLVTVVLGNATASKETFAKEFIGIHPEISKRQVDLKIPEIFQKSGKSYSVKAEFMHLVNQAGTGGIAQDEDSSADKTKKTATKRDRGEDPVAPKKKKDVTGFSFYRKDHLPKIKAELVTDPAYSEKPKEEQNKLLKDAITRAWNTCGEEMSEHYEKKATEENLKSESSFNAQDGSNVATSTSASASPSTGSEQKKAKVEADSKV